MIINNRAVKRIVAAAILSTLAACQQFEPTKQDIGMTAGAVLGGVLGAQIGHGSGSTAATIAGAALGAFLGSSIGKSMDRTDQLATAQALELSQSDRPTVWRNPDTGYTYSVTPTRTYETASGPCREFTTIGQIGGRNETVYGTACRQRDGTWKAL
jgi:surface antigen